MSRAAALIPSLWVAACASAPLPLPEPTWHLVPVGSLHAGASAAPSLRGLAAVDAATAWVTGSGGAILRTRDGGANWQAVGPRGLERADFRDVVAWSADEALVMVAGEPAQLLRTDDGGRSWQVVFAEAAAGAFFDGLAAHGDDVALFGDPLGGLHYLRRSHDRGRSFFVPDLAWLPAPLPGEAGFAASGTCLHWMGRNDLAIATGGGPAARFLRQGPPPVAVELPLQAGAASRGAFSVAFAVDARHGVVVGGDYQAAEVAQGTAAWTADGGATWQAARVPPAGYRSAVLWLGGTRWLATGPGGTSLSGDHGQSWQPFGAIGWHCLARTGDTVWAAGGDGRVGRLQLPR